MEAEGAGLTFVDDAAVAPDQIQAVRPAGVGFLYAIVDAVDQRGETNAQFPDTTLCHAGALALAARIPEQHALADVALHLPEVGRVRLADIYGVKRDLIAKLVIQLVERGNLPAEWRSSIAAENQHNRTNTAIGRQLDRRAVIQRRELEVGRHIARREPTLTGVLPQSLEGQDHHYRPWHSRHNRAE